MAVTRGNFGLTAIASPVLIRVPSCTVNERQQNVKRNQARQWLNGQARWRDVGQRRARLARCRRGRRDQDAGCDHSLGDFRVVPGRVPQLERVVVGVGVVIEAQGIIRIGNNSIGGVEFPDGCVVVPRRRRSESDLPRILDLARRQPDD